MKANELMIGDWVVFPTFHDKPCKVTGIEQYEETHYAKVKVTNVVGAKDMNSLIPIPITAEILEKNGFKIDKNETYCKRYFFACNLGKVPQTVVEFSFYGEGVSADTLFKCWTKPESCDGENSIHICDLKSVHELQHCLNLVGIKKDIVL